MNVLCVSYGNDSIALIQACHESGLRDVHTLYNDTGWASPDWKDRVDAGEALARRYGFTPHRTASIGMEALVYAHKGWPRQGMQFCTEELKIEPTKKWLGEVDPQGMAILYNGKRRAESAKRSDIPLYIAAKDSWFGRLMVSPLYKHTDEQRNALVQAAGFEVLPHRSQECAPCVNASRADLIVLPEPVVANIARIEKNAGFTSKGKPRTMFRPYHFMGATGIREIIRWAKSPRGKFYLDDGNGAPGCDSGMCGG